jgi:phosphoenolpyruvate carboxykinase (GTP)
VNDVSQFLKERLDEKAFTNLMAIENPKMHKFVAESIELTNPQDVFVCTDSDEDINFLRSQAVETGEEKKLKMEGHTYHFDGYNDQARDPSNTKYLLPKGVTLGERLSSMDKEEGTSEVKGFLKDSYKGKLMYICFWCLGPTNSEFSISCIQITDSPYVAHSESILYRPGYEQFRKVGSDAEFFKFLHTEGELDERGNSKNIDNRRIYMDLEDDIVYSTNTQYAGNTVGLKKLALRLAINKASREGWLAEHMFVMGAHGPGGRVTYFTGAFPSACGKTSTAMLPNQTIIGDDIAYLRKTEDSVRCVNVERGIFGIIRDVNPHDDPVIYKALSKPGEVIFGNVLVKDGKPYWMGMGEDLPEEGENYAGKWHKGMTDDSGKEISPSHKNARYTIRISALENRDSLADSAEGVPVGGVIYGGRDSDTWVPVEQAFNWHEGVILKGASLESETTAATLGQEGVRKFNIMANMDFVSIPLGKYIQSNLDFVNNVKDAPLIFSVNYFLRDENGNYLNGILDKLIWVLWAELRVNDDVSAIKTPSGYIPKYEDLAKLFSENLEGDEGKYTQEDYVKQFTVRVPNMLTKIDRVEAIYNKSVADTPGVVYETFNKQRDRLKKAQSKYGDFINPFDLDVQ